MDRICRRIALLLVLLRAAAPSPAQVEPPPREVTAAVRGLRSPHQDERLRSIRRLVERGGRAVPALVQLLGKDLDAASLRTEHGRLETFGRFDDLYYEGPGNTIADLEPWPDDFLQLYPPAEHAEVGLQPWFEWGYDMESDLRVRLAAVFVLGRIGRAAVPAVPTLVSLLAHDDYDLAEDSAQALVNIGEPAVPALAGVLGDRRRRWAAAQALGVMAREVRAARLALAGELTAGRARSREAVLVGLALAGGACTEAEADAVVPRLGESNQRLSRLAAWCLGSMGRAAVPAVARALRGEHGESAVLLAIGAAGLLGGDAQQLVPALLERLGSGVADHMLWSVEALARVAPRTSSADEAVLALLERLPGSSLDYRVACAEALGMFPGQAARVASRLEQMVREEGFLVRYLAVRSLGRLGHPVPALGPVLEEIVTHEGSHVDTMTLGTLRQLGYVDPFARGEERADIGEDLDVRVRRQALITLATAAPERIGFLLDRCDHDELGDAAEAGLVRAGAAAVPGLLQRLADPGLGWQAAAILSRIGEPALQPLCERVDGGDPAVAELAAQALAWMGDPAVPALLDRLRRGGRLAELAAEALAEMGAQDLGRRQVGLVLAAADRARPAVRANLITALTWSEDPRVRPMLVQAAADGDGDVRAAAVRALQGQDVDHADVRRALVRALADDNNEVRAVAAATLGEITTQPDDVLAGLLRCAGDDDAAVRSAALESLGVFTRRVPDVLPVLQTAATDRNQDVRIAALAGIGWLGEAGVGALDTVLLGLRDAAPDVRWEAAWALGALRPDLMAASERLQELVLQEPGRFGGRGFAGRRRADPDDLRRRLDDDRTATRVAALEEAVRLGADGRELLPRILELLRDADADVRRAAVSAAVACGTQATVFGPVTALLQDPAATVRGQVAGRLRAFTERWPEVRELARAAARDADAEVRTAALESLVVLSREDPQRRAFAEPLLCEALGDGEAAVRRRAAALLDSYPQLAPATVQLLIGSLDEPEPEVLAAVVDTLGRARGAAAPALPRLLELAVGESLVVRAACSGTLAKVAPDRPDVLLVLVTALQDDAEAVRNAAESAWQFSLIPW